MGTETESDGLRPVVATTAGLVAGKTVEALGIKTWRAVPYGADTSGRRRFHAPEPVKPWTGVRDCSSYGQPAPQPTYSWMDKIIGDEDCLHLDIVRPDTDDELPVVVYFHGGSFVVGSSNEPVLRGGHLARGLDVVYVSVNFRLGVLGYLDMRYWGDDAVATPALNDQLLALHWVRDNAAAFGGDPDNVTIMGESAGGSAVLSLMAAPKARGLFHRAVSQSAPIAQVHSRAQSIMWSRKLVRDMAMSNTIGIEDLRAADAADLVRSGQSMMWRGGELLQLNSCFAPTVDGDLLEAHPLTVFSRGDQAPVPLIIGTNADEASFGKFIYQRTSRRTRAAGRFLRVYDPQGAEAVLEAYQSASTREEFASILADAVFWAPTVRAASGHMDVAPTWMYRFDYAPQALRWLGLGAMHTVELSAIFGEPHASRAGTISRIGGMQGYHEVAELMQAHWKNFFYHGEPLGDWPRYEAPDRQTMIFDAHPNLESDPKAAKREAWEQFRMTSWGIGRPELTEELGIDVING